jgi:hypothetical protein
LQWYNLWRPILVAVRSKEWVFGRSLTRIVGLNPTGAWMSVSCECCVMSGRVLCDELVPRPEESCRLWCVSNVCDYETSTKRGGPGPYKAVEPYKKKLMKTSKSKMYSTTRKIASETFSLSDINTHFHYHCQ